LPPQTQKKTAPAGINMSTTTRNIDQSRPGYQSTAISPRIVATATTVVTRRDCGSRHAHSKKQRRHHIGGNVTRKYKSTGRTLLNKSSASNPVMNMQAIIAGTWEERADTKAVDRMEAATRPG